MFDKIICEPADITSSIKADFIGKNFPTSQNEHIHVLVKEIDGSNKIEVVEY